MHYFQFLRTLNQQVEPKMQYTKMLRNKNTCCYSNNHFLELSMNMLKWNDTNCSMLNHRKLLKKNFGYLTNLTLVFFKYIHVNMTNGSEKGKLIAFNIYYQLRFLIIWQALTLSLIVNLYVNTRYFNILLQIFCNFSVNLLTWKSSHHLH